MFRGCIIFALLGIGLAFNAANQYVDNILQTSLPAELRAQRLEPAPLPNFRVNFGYRDVYGNLGEADFINGNVTGLSRLRRRSDCQGPRRVAGQYSINCTLTLQSMVTNFNVNVRNGSNYYKVRNMGHVAETLIDVQILGQNFGNLRSFQVSRLGLINPTFNGLPRQMLVYVKTISDSYKTYLHTYLFNTLNDKLKYALQRAMANKPMPRQ